MNAKEIYTMKIHSTRYCSNSQAAVDMRKIFLPVVLPKKGQAA
jgi:hypothetical protein